MIDSVVVVCRKNKTNFKHKLVSLLIVACCLLSLVSFSLGGVGVVNAQVGEHVVAENVDNLTNTAFLSRVTVDSGLAIPFDGNNEFLTKSAFFINTDFFGMSNEVVLVSKLYSTDYTGNSVFGGDPSVVSVLASSVPVVVSNSFGVGFWQTFVFDGSFNLTAGVLYAVSVEVLGPEDFVGVDVYFSNVVGQYPYYMDVCVYSFSAGVSEWEQWVTRYAVGFKVFSVSSRSHVVYNVNWPAGLVGSGSVPVDNNLYIAGDTVVVLSNVGNLVLADYVFLGWSFSASALVADFVVSGVSVVPSSFVMPSVDVVLFAVWSYDSGSVTPSPSPSFSVLPSAPVSVVDLDLFFGVEEVDVFGVVGFGLSEVKSKGGLVFFEDSLVSSVDVGFGFRVWLVSERGVRRELSGGVPVGVSVLTLGNGSFSGFVSSSWVCPDTVLVLGGEVLEVVVYSAVGDGVNTVARAVFVSEPLVSDRLVGGLWVFNVRVDYDPLGSGLFVLSWGGGLDVGVFGVVVREASVYQNMWFRLVNLDFLGFVVTPYVFILGSLFYVFVLVGLVGAFYIWHGKVSVVLYIWVLLGAAAGCFSWLPLGAGVIVWLLVAVAFAVLLFRMFR